MAARLRAHLTTTDGVRYDDVLCVQNPHDPGVDVWSQTGRHEGEPHPDGRHVLVMHLADASLHNRGGLNPTGFVRLADGTEWELEVLRRCCGAWTQGFRL
jgi:hypothetical protein